jgi:hypothetical protein
MFYNDILIYVSLCLSVYQSMFYVQTVEIVVMYYYCPAIIAGSGVLQYVLYVLYVLYVQKNT